jgi:molybdopterin-guanine dinucleotide biosynthesis protein A
MLSSVPIADGKYVGVVACDTPFVKAELYNMLFAQLKTYECALCCCRGLPEPLHAVFRKDAMLSALRKVRACGATRPLAAYQELNTIYVDELVLRRVDPQLISFYNINSWEELECAARAVEERC